MAGISNSISFFNRLLTIAAATCVTAGVAFAGGLERNISLDPQHRALGESYLLGGNALQSKGGASVALRVHIGAPYDIAFYASAVMISPEWGLTAWHSIGGVQQFGEITGSVSTGPNFLNVPGQTVDIAEFISYPGCVPYNPETPDLALFRLSSPIEGIGPVEFAQASVGQVLTTIGYGSWGSEAVGMLPQDGNIRAVRAPVNPRVVNFFNPEFFQQVAVNPNDNINLLGRTLPGDSGAGVFNANGQLVGVNVAGTNGTVYSGQSTFMKMSPTVQDWIVANTRTACAADFNRDGMVDFFDYQEYVECFEGNACERSNAVDFNNDGFVDFFDYDDYVLAFERGC